MTALPNDSSSSALDVGSIAMAAGAVALGLLAAKYNDRALFYERRKGVPFAKSHPLIGDLLFNIMNKATAYDTQLGRFERLDTLTFAATSLTIPPVMSTIDPTNIEYFLKTNFENYVKGPRMLKAMGPLFGNGILVANGQAWRSMRKTAAQIFNVANFRDHFTDVFIRNLHIMCDKIFDPKASNCQSVDFADVMFKFTLDSFVLIGFGEQIDALSNRDKVPFAESFDICQLDCIDRFINPFLPLFEAVRAITPGKKTVAYHHAVVDKFARNVIARRRAELANGEQFKDLLSRFMNAHNEHNTPLSDTELRDVIINFIIAGRDTTAEALSWTFYNLMLHPRIEAKLVEEIRACIRDEHEKDSPALYHAIKDMTYAHAVFYEVLRLYPSVPNNLKVALGDDIWPDGTTIKKGDSIVWGTYSLGRSTKVWGPDAKQFRPERWITPEGKLRHESQGQFPVFHVGPRACLGQTLATLEALVAIVLLLKRYKFTLMHDQEITYEVSLTMPMKNGMKLFVEKREL